MTAWLSYSYLKQARSLTQKEYEIFDSISEFIPNFEKQKVALVY